MPEDRSNKNGRPLVPLIIGILIAVAAALIGLDLTFKAWVASTLFRIVSG